MDAKGRQEVFRHYLGRVNSGQVDVSSLVGQTPYYTPADIEAVCMKAAQAAFEEQVATGQDRRVGTEDLVHAVRSHRATLTSEGLTEFRQDIREFCRADYCRVLLEEQ